MRPAPVAGEHHRAGMRRYVDGARRLERRHRHHQDRLPQTQSLDRGRMLSQITELVARVVQVLRDLDHPQRLPGLNRGTGEGRNQAVVTVSPPPLDDWASQGRTC